MKKLQAIDYTRAVCQFLKKYGYAAEVAIDSDSLAEDFFNVILPLRDGTKTGLVGIPVDGDQRILRVVLKDGMTHQQLFFSLTIGLVAVIAFSKMDSTQPTQDCLAAYSYYDNAIKQIVWKLKHVNHRLRRAQKRFHSAEGALHKMLIKNTRLSGEKIPYDDSALRIQADLYMEQFCDAFALREKLQGELEDMIHADAEGKKSLEKINQVVAH